MQTKATYGYKPLNVIFCRSPFSSNHLHQTFPVAALKTSTTLRRNFGPFFPTEILQFMNISGRLCVQDSDLAVPKHNLLTFSTTPWLNLLVCF